MEDFVAILQEYGPYVAMPVVVAVIVQSLKKSFKKFFTQNHIGVRVIHFVPVVLGLLGGLLLPLETIREQLLVGCALGSVSHIIYKAVTKTFVPTSKLMGGAESTEE